MFSLPANPAGTKRSLLRTHPPPPALDLARARPREAALASGGAPKIRVGDVAVPDHDDNEGETLQLSSSSSSSDSESESPSPPLHTHGDRTGLGKSSSKSTLAPLRSSSRTSSRSSSRTRSADDKNDSALPEDITKDLAALQQLRRSVKTNLRLRPIRSRSNLPKMNLNLDIEGVIPPAPLPLSVREGEGIPTRGNGIYPTINTTAINTANPPPLSASSPASSAYYTPTAETPHTAFFSARNPRAPFDYTPLPIPLLQPTNLANPIAPGELADRLQALRRPLLLDTRPSKLYSQVRLKGSVNVVLPLARRRLESLDELREYVTTQDGKTRWDALIGGGSQWDGGLVVINDGETDDVHASLIAALQVPRVPMAYLSGSLYSLPLEPFIVTEPTGTPQHAMLFAIKNRGTPLSSPLPPLPANIASPISARGLYNRLTAPSRPLLIDTRPLAAHQAFHLRDSVSIAIPSLILKRCRKPGGGLPSLSALKQFATTEQGKAHWDILMGVDGGWDGNVVIYDDEMDVKDRDSPGVTAWAIMPVISPLLKSDGRIEYLEGGLARAGHDPDLGTLVVTGDEVEAAPSRTGTPRSGGFAKKNGGGLFQLDTDSALKFKKLPEIDLNPSPASNPPSPLPAHAPAVQGKGLPPSPLPIMPSTSRTSSSLSPSTSVADASPSPPPSSIGFRRPPPPRRPSVPALRRLDTRSAERLVPPPPKLSLRTKPMRSATLTVPPALTLNIGGLGGPPQSPSHLQLMYSTHSPPLSARFLSPTGDPTNYLTPYYTPPHTPSTPRLGFGFYPDDPPPTARPDMDPPTTEDAFPVFTVSTILPNFLYLGPELTTPEHVKELRDLGVKRVLNIAAECDDDMGLGLRQAFRYCKIPMRDTVEEDGIAKGVSEACNFIGELFGISVRKGMDAEIATLISICSLPTLCRSTLPFHHRRRTAALGADLRALQGGQVALSDGGDGVPHSRKPLDTVARIRVRA